MPRFSKGLPRNGQWVVLGGRVGIAYALKDQAMVLAEDGEIFVRVDLVHPKTGHTGDLVKAKLSELSPLTDKSKIPAQRLKTMDPKWNPRP